MLLWSHWWPLVSQLRPACSRRRSFLWLAVTLAAMGVRHDLGGVTSFVRVLGLKPACYGCLLGFFHSPAVGVDALARTWVRVVLKVHPGVQRVNGRLVLFADGLKKAKAGRKMPAGKALHQASDANTKPEYIIHPRRGRILLLSTDLSLEPAEIIRLYALRFKIEVTFKQALHTVGTWAYHFWMRGMTPLRRCQGDQYLHRASERHRAAIRRKLAAYHRHIQIGLVAQGLLPCLAATRPALVWRHFGSWLRTVRTPHCPSELVVACALRNSLPESLATTPQSGCFALFLRDRLDLQRTEGSCLASAA